MASASAIEVRIGRGDPSAMSLNAGTVLDPTSIGKTGMWRVDGPGVLDVHGYIYFDGKALYVQSADDKSPLMVNKHRVSTAWTEVKAGSTIEVGRAELFYRAGSAGADADATVARPMTGMPGQHSDEDPDSTSPKRPSNPTMMDPQGPKQGVPLFRPGGGAFANRADDESTRLRPMDEAPAMGAPQAAPRPAAGAPMARPNIQRPMMDAQESTVIAPIEDLSGGRSAGPRPGMTGMGGAPGGPQMMGQQMGMAGGPQMGGPQMGMNGPPQMGMPGGQMGMGAPGMRPGQPGMPGQMGMPGQGMPGGMPGQMGGMPGQQGMPGQPWGMPGGNPQGPTVQQQAVSNSPIEKFKADFASFPPAKRAIYIGMPFLMVAAVIFLFTDSTPDAPTKPATTAATPSTPAGGMGGLPATPMTGSTAAIGIQAGMQGADTQTPAGFQGGSLTPTAKASAAANIFGNPPPVPSASASASASATGGTKPPPANTAAATAAGGDAGTLDPAMGVDPKNKTNERKAADAWSEGNYELAAQMYDELAREQPGNPAFPAAASILREKLDGGIH